MHNISMFYFVCIVCGRTCFFCFRLHMSPPFLTLYALFCYSFIRVFVRRCVSGHRRLRRSEDSSGISITSRKNTELLKKRSSAARGSKTFTMKKKSNKTNPIAQKAKSHGLTTKSGTNTWWATVVGDPSFLEQWKPPPANIHTNFGSGAWEVAYPSCGRTSVSWTRRCPEAATQICLKWLWEKNKDCYKS